MYTEFLIIYIGLGILVLLGIAILILLIMLLKKDQGAYIPQNNNYIPNVQTTATPSGNIVFCKKCAAEFDSSQRACPKCGTPR